MDYGCVYYFVVYHRLGREVHTTHYTLHTTHYTLHTTVHTTHAPRRRSSHTQQQQQRGAQHTHARGVCVCIVHRDIMLLDIMLIALGASYYSTWFTTLYYMRYYIIPVVRIMNFYIILKYCCSDVRVTSKNSLICCCRSPPVFLYSIIRVHT
jgi:hypothetical protein